MSGRVIVVDDIQQNVKLLEAKLTSEYYTVLPTYSGKEVLEKIKDFSPDIVLLDVMMPEMDGFEVCKRLKEDPETAHIPVIMVTALSEITDRVKGLQSGANDFLTKPIDEIHLFARVKSLIRMKLMLDELRMRDKTGAHFGINASSGLLSQARVTGNIMVIDDDVVESKRIKEALEKSGNRVRLEDPEKALDDLAKEDFDLVITSAMLDDMDGLRLDMQIRSQERSRHIPLMMLVDEDNKPLLVKALEMGIDDYILTPMDMNELVARVLTQLRRKKYQDALKSSYEENVTASVVDSLTKLYNRRYLDVHLRNIVKESLDRNLELSIMTVDIDHFKAVNDKPGWGHHIGDEVLKEIAKRIKDSLRGTDLATRPGGEEFIVVMPNTKSSMAEMVAMRTNKIISEKPIKISAEPGDVRCTVSIGVASLKHDGSDSAEALLKRSDEALYTAKNTGRNRVVGEDRVEQDSF